MLSNGFRIVSQLVSWYAGPVRPSRTCDVLIAKKKANAFSRARAQTCDDYLAPTLRARYSLAHEQDIKVVVAWEIVVAVMVTYV